MFVDDPMVDDIPSQPAPPATLAVVPVPGFDPFAEHKVEKEFKEEPPAASSSLSSSSSQSSSSTGTT
jgi:hypothetical protein